MESRAIAPAEFEDVQPLDQHNHPYYHFILNAWCENPWVMAATQWVKQNPYEASWQLLRAALVLSSLGAAFFPAATAASMAVHFFFPALSVFSAFDPNANKSDFIKCFLAAIIIVNLYFSPFTTILGCLFAYGLLDAIDDYSLQPVDVYHEHGEVDHRMENPADRDAIISAVAFLGEANDSPANETHAAPARRRARLGGESANSTGLMSASMFMGGDALAASIECDENAPQAPRTGLRRRG